MFRGTRATNSFTVETPGGLYVASYFPGEWSTRTGDLATPDEAYAGVTGDLDMLILRNVIDLGQRKSGLDVLPSRAEIILRSLFSTSRD